MSQRDPHDVICVVTAQNPAQAHIFEQALLNAGIEAKVVGDYLDAGIGDVSSMRAEVWVHREDKEKAEHVLKHELEGGAADEDDDDDGGDE